MDEHVVVPSTDVTQKHCGLLAVVLPHSGPEVQGSGDSGQAPQLSARHACSWSQHRGVTSVHRNSPLPQPHTPPRQMPSAAGCAIIQLTLVFLAAAALGAGL